MTATDHLRRVREAKAAGTRPPLTARQRGVLAAIAAHYAAADRPPTYRELCDAVGIASPNGLIAHLRALEAKGYLRPTRVPPGSGRPASARCIEVVGLAEARRPATAAFFAALLAPTDRSDT